MDEQQPRRITRALTPAEHKRLRRHRGRIEQELPDLAARDQMRRDAREEDTLSGELRRVIHASERQLPAIAAQVGITPLLLDDFLTGERTLRSDVMDRLASALGCALSSVT